MNSKLARHLCNSVEVRAALKKEALRLLALVCFTLVLAVGIRYFTERPLLKRFDSLWVTLAAIALIWLVSVVRTVRRVLREHSLL